MTASRLTRTALIAASTTLALAAPVAVAAQSAAARPAAAKPTVGRALINGVNYYYEIHGTGEPLFMLHGGLGSSSMFHPYLAEYTKTRKVILVDLQGHGHTPLGERPFALTSMGDDMAALATKLGFDQVDVFGYSFGGGVAMRFAMQHPTRVKRLVLLSAGFASDAFYPAMREQQKMVSAEMAPMMKDTPMHTTYMAEAPDVKEFPRLLQVMGDLMRSEYSYAADVPRLTMPVLLIFGDADMYRPEHVVEFYKLLGGGKQDAGWARETISKNRLAIIPDLTHYDIFTSPRVSENVRLFLDGKTDAKTWAPPAP